MIVHHVIIKLSKMAEWNDISDYSLLEKRDMSYLIRWNNFTDGSECVLDMFMWISTH